MLTVYVKHYLTDHGIHYFKNEWFPEVSSVIAQQPGFVSIVYDINQKEKDLIDIVLKFQDDDTLDAWIAVPIHDNLIKALDVFRSRDYWEAARADEHADPSSLEWMIIRPGS